MEEPDGDGRESAAELHMESTIGESTSSGAGLEPRHITPTNTHGQDTANAPVAAEEQKHSKHADTAAAHNQTPESVIAYAIIENDAEQEMTETTVTEMGLHTEATLEATSIGEMTDAVAEQTENSRSQQSTQKAVESDGEVMVVGAAERACAHGDDDEGRVRAAHDRAAIANIEPNSTMQSSSKRPHPSKAEAASSHTVQSHVLGNATLELASGFLKLSGGCGRASQPACFLNQLRKCASCQRYAEIKEICLPACRILSRAACAARNKSIVTCNGESCDS